MENYRNYIPAEFKYGVQTGVIIVAQIKEAIAKGVMHFRVVEPYSYIPDIKDIMQEINNKGCLFSWSKEYPEKTMGLHDFGAKTFHALSVLVPMRPSIYEQVKPFLKEEEKSGVHTQA